MSFVRHAFRHKWGALRFLTLFAAAVVGFLAFLYFKQPAQSLASGILAPKDSIDVYTSDPGAKVILEVAVEASGGAEVRLGLTPSVPGTNVLWAVVHEGHADRTIEGIVD